MKTITILLLSISLAFSGVAQQQQGRGNDDTNPYRIFGSVEDSESNSPVQYATISLYTSADSVLVTGMITNPLGRFDLKTNPGNYYLKIDFIGYESRIVSGVTLNPDQKVFDAGSIVLNIQIETLAEIEITAERSRIEIGLDKKVFIVGKDLSSIGEVHLTFWTISRLWLLI